MEVISSFPLGCFHISSTSGFPRVVIRAVPTSVARCGIRHLEGLWLAGPILVQLVCLSVDVVVVMGLGDTSDSGKRCQMPNSVFFWASARLRNCRFRPQLLLSLIKMIVEPWNVGHHMGTSFGIFTFSGRTHDLLKNIEILISHSILHTLLSLIASTVF